MQNSDFRFLFVPNECTDVAAAIPTGGSRFSCLRETRASTKGRRNSVSVLFLRGEYVYYNFSERTFFIRFLVVEQNVTTNKNLNFHFFVLCMSVSLSCIVVITEILLSKVCLLFDKRDFVLIYIL